MPDDVAIIEETELPVHLIDVNVDGVAVLKQKGCIDNPQAPVILEGLVVKPQQLGDVGIDHGLPLTARFEMLGIGRWAKLSRGTEQFEHEYPRPIPT
jgi:hypothetical protein